MGQPLLFYAVIALSAMHVSQTTAPSARPVAEMYHTRCIRYLISLDSGDPLIEQGVALATTCLLRSYEILAEGHDPNRHLKGAYSLVSHSLASELQRNFFDDPSGGLLHSGFWNYLREDITFSLFGHYPLKIDLDHIPKLRNVSSDQDHLNAISLLLGRIINIAFGPTPEKAGHDWEVALSYIKDWLSDLPAHCEPFSRAKVPPFSGLPTAHMLKPCHGNTLSCDAPIRN
ncbi:putative phytanoyl- dioxygenase [Rosellinia necatrix]|uniref:Putative phytanoyl-dioxygenase n=1 Tax=Rosellinia necatrix TaxID=77044 RepID=A0A1S8A5K0_ROSNE|nr:putative phytanoyl- dioxygenase [Rosellinia necatrix]